MTPLEAAERTKDLCEKVSTLSDAGKLVIAAKGRHAPTVAAALDAQFQATREAHAGENYVQEALEHKLALQTTSPELYWHFQGNIQSNKVGKIVELVGKEGFVHSVSSIELAQKLSEARQELTGAPLNVFLEVNVGGEETKGGFTPDSLEASAEEIGELAGIQAWGVMALPPLNDKKSVAKGGYLRDTLELNEKLGFKSISLGTSHDFEKALELGVEFNLQTHFVRLGEAIFGPLVKKI